jgi:ADP-ribose pyrophosphatase
MKEKTIHSKTAFCGRLLRLEVQDVELEDGTRSVREIVRHPGAAAVLAMLDDSRFLLVKQFRKAVEAYSTEITDAKTLAAWGLHETLQPIDLFGKVDASS